MPDAKYYHTQAQLCAGLALTAADTRSAARYNELAVEYLAKAKELEAGTTDSEPTEQMPPVKGAGGRENMSPD